MATIDKIPTITRIFVPLGRREFDDREFHALPSFMKFIQETLPGLGRGVLGADQSPADQMDSLLRRWNAGKPMSYGRAFSTLKPTRRAVWEMKTADLRLFGWLYRPRVFVGAFAGFADDYKRQNGASAKESYDAARDRVAWLRDRLDLDPPLFVTGDYNALV
jgi:hypothetical protein